MASRFDMESTTLTLAFELGGFTASDKASELPITKGLHLSYMELSERAFTITSAPNQQHPPLLSQPKVSGSIGTLLKKITISIHQRAVHFIRTHNFHYDFHKFYSHLLYPQPGAAKTAFLVQ
ncbi:MAG: hypothetical protein CM1200mP3_10880 [Chloroflexota bacterium]|nr:MAG: hypothetical protein CM1200mP3_10880 [Chloroflexota bacterium]